MNIHRHTHRSFQRLILGLTITLLGSAVLAPAQNTLRWTTNYYTVTGASLPELHQSFNQARPWKNSSKLDGFTEWRIDWRFAVASAPDGCRCVSFTTTTTITITLPRWVAPTNTPPNVKKIWERYITALGQHEAGHAQIALAAMTEQHKRIKDIGRVPDCDGLRQKIDGVARRVIDDYRERDAEYDRRTEHGTRQGAFLPRREGKRPPD